MFLCILLSKIEEESTLYLLWKLIGGLCMDLIQMFNKWRFIKDESLKFCYPIEHIELECINLFYEIYSPYRILNEKIFFHNKFDKKSITKRSEGPSMHVVLCQISPAKNIAYFLNVHLFSMKTSTKSITQKLLQL